MPFSSRKSFGKFFPFVMPLAAILLVYTLLRGEIQMLLVFAVLIAAFSIYRFDPRIPIGYAISLFVIQGVLTAHYEDVSVEFLAILSYWLLIVGIVCIIIGRFRKKRPVQAVA